MQSDPSCSSHDMLRIYSFNGLNVKIQSSNAFFMDLPKLFKFVHQHKMMLSLGKWLFRSEKKITEQD